MRTDKYIVLEGDAFREESERLNETTITDPHVVTDPCVSMNGAGVTDLAIEVNR